MHENEVHVCTKTKLTMHENKVYLAEDFFCEVYLTCVSSKLCEFIYKKNPSLLSIIGLILT